MLFNFDSIFKLISKGEFWNGKYLHVMLMELITPLLKSIIGLSDSTEKEINNLKETTIKDKEDNEKLVRDSISNVEKKFAVEINDLKEQIKKQDKKIKELTGEDSFSYNPIVYIPTGAVPENQKSLSKTTIRTNELSQQSYFNTGILDTAGLAWGWGENNYGQLGSGDAQSSSIPVAVCLDKTYHQLSVGQEHTLGIDYLGNIWSWGKNDKGQLGLTYYSGGVYTPSAVILNKTMVQVAAGTDHTLALTQSGQVWSWGGNSSGQLGEGSYFSTATPTQICANLVKNSFQQISTGGTFTVALSINGMAWAWGAGAYGELGNGLFSYTANRCTPIAVCLDKTYQSLAAGQEHTLALDYQGKLWSWGNNNYGQLGDGSTNSRSMPVAVCSNLTYTAIAAGQYVSLAIDNFGRIKAWGRNESGQLGIGTNTNVNTPTAVCTTRTFIQISSGGSSSMGLDSTGRIWSWGQNVLGQLGIGIFTERCTPTAVCSTRTFIEISMGVNHAVAIEYNGNAWAWGAPLGLGNNSNAIASIPVAVCLNKTYTAIAAGSGLTIGLDSDGNLWSWGLAAGGRLGNNTNNINVSTPIAVCSSLSFIYITAGFGMVGAIDSNNDLWMWGNNTYGGLGDNTKNEHCIPTSVYQTLVPNYFSEIACGDDFSLALDNNRKLWSWGKNDYGQLGSLTARNIPAWVSNVTFIQIAAGDTHGIGLDPWGKLWSWGKNDSGQLGINNTTNKITPVAVCTDRTFIQISAGYKYNLALDYEYGLWGWGKNFAYEIDADGKDKLTPVQICNGYTFTSIAAGYNVTQARDFDGYLWIQGRRNYLL